MDEKIHIVDKIFPVSQYAVWDGRYLFQVVFEDSAGQKHCWVPRWDDLRTIFERAIQTEISNDPSSPEMGVFIDWIERAKKHIKERCGLLRATGGEDDKKV